LTLWCGGALFKGFIGRIDSSGSDDQGTVSAGSDNHGTVSAGSDNHGTISVGSDNHGTVGAGSDNDGTVSAGSDNHRTISAGSDNHGTVSAGSDNHRTVSAGSDNHGAVSAGSDNGKSGIVRGRRNGWIGRCSRIIGNSMGNRTRSNGGGRAVLFLRLACAMRSIFVITSLATTLTGIALTFVIV